MGKINLLPDRLISKIAAGEAVERPASVIKECIENSLDAGAQKITVEIKKAGKNLISVKDNGEGIEPGDIEKLFRRHATSKLKDSDDLYRIASLGFRGEALYSIGAVADVILKSRHKNSKDAGKEIHIRGGERIALKDSGRPPGTTIEVRELFFNTPARKKFLKADSTEFRQILNIFLPYALAYPEKIFSLTHNGRNAAVYHPVSDRLERICEALNVEKKHLITGEKEFAEKGGSLKLFLGDINLKRPRRDQQYVFINNRPVYSQSILYQVNQVYKAVFPRDVFPIFAAFITLPCKNVDVNIHPTKREVKLKDDREIAYTVFSFSQELLMGKGGASAVKREVIYFPQRNIEGFKKETAISENSYHAEIFDAEGEKEDSSLQNPVKTKLEKAAYVGIYRNKYLFFEAGDTLLAIDQHAAHERINYEKLKKEFESGKIETQQLLSPMIIKLGPEEMSSWEDGKDKMEEVGFFTTRWDEGSIALHGFPHLIRNPELAVRSILSEKYIGAADREKLARKACRGSIMAGEKIREEDALYIRDALLQCEVPFVCPHGRPTIVEFSESFFDRQFLR